MLKVQPIDQSHLSSFKNPVVIERTINASTQDIWLVISNNSTWIHWYPNMSKCETTSSHDGLGSTRRVKQSWWLSDERIVLWEPNHEWGYTVESYNAPIFKHLFEQITLEAIHDDQSTPRTIVRYTGIYEAHWLVWFYSWQIHWELSRLWKEALQGLEQYCSENQS